MKKIVIIFTGGTISMDKTTEDFKSDIFDNRESLVKKISFYVKDVEIKTVLFSLLPSPFLKPSDFLKLSFEVKKYLEDDSIYGIVITHGTDTLDESSFFLDTMFSVTKPTVFTGAMRNYSELGYDGFNNLLSSVLVASNSMSKGKGVLVVLNDEINSAFEVTKTHTFSLGTFKSLDFGPLGIIDENKVYYQRSPILQKYHFSPSTIDKKVEIVKAYSGGDSMFLDFLIDSKIDGIVIEGLGRGNVPKEMVPGILKAIENKIPVLMTSRCPSGRVLDTYSYIGGGDYLKKIGVIFCPSLSSQKARIKLLLILSSKTKFEEIENYFNL
jgi:L-asparaginase